MKKIKFLSLLAAACVFLFAGCSKDEGPQEYEVDLTTNNTTTISTGTVDITWTIQVHSAQTTGKTSGLSGATVNVVGKGGSVNTATTDANGFATFTGMVQGIASATVTMSGYTTINLTADLYTGLTLELGEDVTKFATTDIMLWPLDAEVAGVAYGNFDGDGVTYPNDTTGDDTRSGMTVYITCQLTTWPFANNADAGKIIEYSIEPNYFSSTVASASSGTYSITGLPGNDVNGSLTILIGGHEFIDAGSNAVWDSGPTDISASVWPALDITRNIQFF